MNGGGIGKQVAGELGGVAKQAVEELKSVVSGPVPSEVQGPEEQEARDRSQRRARWALERVRQELENLFEKGKQEKAQKDGAKERQEEVKKEEEEQRKESEREAIIRRAHTQGGGTGEMARQKH